MYKNYLFDLDGTLLPMDMKHFIELFSAAFSHYMAPITKMDAKLLMNAVWASVSEMSRNDGLCPNIHIFWRTMNLICKRDMRVYSDQIDAFYRTDFSVCRTATKVQPLANTLVRLIKQNGGNLIVATNPIFPKSATYSRLEWAGLNVHDFSYITTYDNSSACKPNLNYFEEICSVCDILPEESLMIGNDTAEDMVSSRLGFDTFLVTDCLINRCNKNLRLFHHGSFEELFHYFQNFF
ncbi:MAG: HAD family hydrolase [Ruminococcus sp.]|nr:HAD family hydrolase [Ruminococcus sp.]